MRDRNQKLLVTNIVDILKETSTEQALQICGAVVANRLCDEAAVDPIKMWGLFVISVSNVLAGE